MFYASTTTTNLIIFLGYSNANIEHFLAKNNYKIILKIMICILSSKAKSIKFHVKYIVFI